MTDEERAAAETPPTETPPAPDASAAAAELARRKHEKEAEAAAAGVPGEVVRLVADVERGLRADLAKLRTERAPSNTMPATTAKHATGEAGGGGALAVGLALLVLLGLAVFAGWKRRQEART